ncbi:E3 ubiquitin-protein ligase WAV3-like [Panicum virgatum]|uniref:E3 ubiquitin-protein ligase WAV3-like n=1 Tax=Panicum virgatum TaxID=38727 RepID=UPI0019D66226|nr:E3 ubiquitin-protein ligase WAV3-like [Panicum virgatum]
MLQVKAPTLVGEEVAGGTPLDLVAVLDVSGSMAGPKLEEVKRGMGFVVDSLGPRDRLCVVAMSDDARRVVRLTRMSGDGKAAARRAVESLVAAGSTNTRAGLDKAAKVIKESRNENDDVAGRRRHPPLRRLDTNTTDYSDLVPPYLVLDGQLRSTPVHTFAFGWDHDEEALHGISAATRGTSSFTENHAAIQDALALCVGGLRSVTAQDVLIEVECWDDDGFAAVKSGCYENSINRDEGASVSVDELFADEERRFLFFLDVPSIDYADYLGTRLLKVRCHYVDIATAQDVSVDSAYARVKRPVDAAPVAPSMEVEWELLRVKAVVLDTILDP